MVHIRVREGILPIRTEIVLVCTLSIWVLSRIYNWHPQKFIPTLINTCLYPLCELFVFETVRVVLNKNDDTQAKGLNHTGTYLLRVRRVAALIATLTTIYFSPKISKHLGRLINNSFPRISNYFGFSMSLRASAIFVIPSVLESYFTPDILTVT